MLLLVGVTPISTDNLQINDSYIFDWISGAQTRKLEDTKSLISTVCTRLEALGVIPALPLKESLELLRLHEPILYFSKKRYRDHLIHACRVAIAGDILLSGTIASERGEMTLLALCRELMKQDERYRRIFQAAKWKLTGEDDDDIDYELRRAWYIGSLLHDVGYAFEAYIQVRQNIKSFDRFPKIHKFFERVDSALTDLRSELPVPGLLETVPAQSHESPIHPAISSSYIASLGKEDEPALKIASLMAYLHDSIIPIEFTKDPLCLLLAIVDNFQDWGRPMIKSETFLRALGRIPDQSARIRVSIEEELPVEMPEFSISSVETNYLRWQIVNDVLKIDFTLNFDDKSADLKSTGFNFPLFVYSKQRAFARLNLGNKETLASIFKTKLELTPQLKLVAQIFAQDGLSQEWDRQATILQWKSKSVNIPCYEWISKIIADIHWNETAVILDILEGEPPKPNLESDLEKRFIDIELDGQVQDDRVYFGVEYEKDRSNELAVSAACTWVRNVVNTSNEPVSEWYAALGDFVPAVAPGPSITHVKVNGQEVSEDDVKPVFLDIGSSGLKSRMALIFPLEKWLGAKLAKGKPVELEYKVIYKTQKTALTPDYFINRREGSIGNLTVDVRFEPKLFRELFVGGLTHKARLPEWDDPRCNGLIEKTQSQLRSRIVPEGYVSFEKADIKNDLLRFEARFNDVKQFEAAGWVWIKHSAADSTVQPK